MQSIKLREGDSETVPDSSTGVPPAVAGASRPRFGTVTIRNRGKLPYWEAEGATYFVTFRLADSLPKSVLDQIESERRAIIRTATQLRRPLSSDERKRLQHLSIPIIERFLDSGSGSCHLKHPAVASCVADALRYFDGHRYRLFARCIMPNHVHVVFKVFPGHVLADVVHSWKSLTAKQANRILGAKGTFWQREYYDHLVRDADELEHAVRYVMMNPEKAKLSNWEWIWMRGQDARANSRRDAGAT